MVSSVCILVFIFKQKTAYELRISDWSSDVCSSDLVGRIGGRRRVARLEASARVDRDVDEHRAGAHRLQHVAGHKLGRLGARDQHRADDQIGAIGRGAWRERESKYV